MDEDRLADVGEFAIDTAYRIDGVWSFGFDGRYDVLSGEPTSTGLQVGWQNECVTVDFSVSRRFTSSTTVEPSNDFGLEIGLSGFSAGRSGSATPHSCTN